MIRFLSDTWSILLAVLFIVGGFQLHIPALFFCGIVIMILDFAYHEFRLPRRK
ncbi:hypothetical protein CPT_Moby_276 [Stenotrophomonas phage Moby]|uniref:Uncharacterized protein n=1 Tax=Stenotrophomonas phage Moby TaxID=2601680 RepID=A0A5P8PMM3_9CAUD|nr:hypothetical protein HWC58_gp122 [Stenotrophomonas phage Moby]QFR58001.1 hypothetical protein CPT_Moby_276 [Stenotrophomonas phage Moby]